MSVDRYEIAMLAALFALAWSLMPFFQRAELSIALLSSMGA